MNAPDQTAQPDPARAGPPPSDRPETSRPPRLSEAPLDDLQSSSDSLDIDELLPVAFDPAALRVAMGPDLAELLRAAEERIGARGEASQSVEIIEDEIDGIPVPEDVLALLAEPLEADDDDDGATGAAMGAATGAGRSHTRDVPAPTSHGQEEDLEQPLPRASSLPATPLAYSAQQRAHETPVETASRALTGAGRPDLTPFPEPPRASRITSQSHTAEHLTAHELPLAAEPPPRDVRAPFSSDRDEPRSPAIERNIYAERGPVIDLSGVSPITSERAAVTDRQPAIERSVPSARIVARAPVIEAPRTPTLKMVALSAIDFGDTASPKSRAQPSRNDITPPPSPVRAPAPEPVRAPLRTEAVPAVLGPGDAPRAVGRAIASRVSGALTLTSGDDQRRILLHDGDVVTAGSSAPLESLVAFLSARGDIDRDLVPRLAGKLPPFGRHAGAALVAHGYLGQDDLWPVLRAHAEWVMGRALLMESGVCEVEPDPPARYKAEPGVFGGATGAEVFVEAVRRVITPEEGLARLGGPAARVAPGPRTALLAECALPPDEEDRVRGSAGHTVREVAGEGATERSSVLYALLCLDVIDALPAVSPAERASPGDHDPLDDEAVRARVRARLALVEEGDYFALLGVSRAATSYDIRRAYLDLRRTFEPARLLTATTADLIDDVRLVVEVIEEAYEILRDHHRRERYRRAIEGSPPR